MYKKILIAYDGSSYSDVALQQGANLARLCNAQLHLVGIIATNPYVVAEPGFGSIDIWSMESKSLEAALASAVKDLAGEGLEAGTSIREGNPAHEIATCAVQEQADLVVVGHSDKGAFARWFEGSVGEGLVRHLPCNLLVATN